MWRYAVPSALFLVLTAFLLRGLHLNPTAIESPLIGQLAPGFELPNLLDRSATVKSDDFNGEMFLLNAWAVWCEYCEYEHPFLMDLAEDGVKIVGLNWKELEDPIAWLQSLGNPYITVAEDLEGHVGIDWGIYGAPESFLVGPTGIVLQKHIGPLTPEVWDQKFAPLIEAQHRTFP